MYAIVEIKGKQYKVAPKDILDVDKMDASPKDEIILDKVLMLSNGKKIEVGKPYVEGVTVEAQVVSQDKARKVVVFKYLRRKDSHKKTGHRQQYTKLEIKKINNK